MLQHSVRMTKSRHDIEMVAIVHKDVKTTRPGMEKLGFRLIDFSPPILSSEIRGQHLRETIDASGCCGALELLKLCAWKLTDYDWVVAIDMDAVWIKSLDHLFERTDVPPGGFFFTYDFAMDNPGSKAPPAQGGFFALKPSIDTYEQLVDTVRIGDFRPSTGWGGSGIGWCWGGQTIQGLLAYYANLIDTSKGFPLDPCVYNSMSSTPPCSKVDFSTVKSIHYTVCQKPWECHRGDYKSICSKFLHAWWMIREDLEKLQGVLEPAGRCCNDLKSPYCKTIKYEDLKLGEMKTLPVSDPNNFELDQEKQIVILPEDLA